MVEAAAPKVVKAKKPAKKAEHPPSAVMVVAAVKALKESKGSSLAAIKKYIAANNKVIDNQICK
jgi:histone H1/5